MKTNVFLLNLLILLAPAFLIVSVSAQSPYQHTDKIACGNNICEAVALNLKIGEEKSIEIAGKTHTFRLIKIEKEETPYLTYNVYLSIDNGPAMLADEAKEKTGINFNCCGFTGDASGVKIEEGAQINFAEDKICPVPDCAFPVELNVYKKWNLVPIYLLFGIAPPKSTCKLEDFKVIYAYNPLQNNFVKLHSFGDSKSNLETASSNFQRNFESERILAGAPFSSVWIYSDNECKLSGELPRLFENLLVFLKKLTEQTIQRPYLPGESPPPPEKIMTTFASGWNFFIGSKDMQGKNFDEIKGSCNIEKAYTFDASSQSWKQLTTAPGPGDNFIFKASNKCMFGFPEIAPPEIPT